MNRRTFLEVGSSVFTLPFLMGATNPHFNSKNKPKANKAKSVINIFLDGGISHIDFTHAHPELQSANAPINGPIRTQTPDLWFGADWEQLAKISNKLTVLHSHGHNSANHESAKYMVNSGYFSPRLGSQEYPSRGSYISKFLGPSNSVNGLPVYLRIGKTEGDESGFIGSAYNPFDANDKGTQDLVMNLGLDRFKQRLNILNMVDNNINQQPDQVLKNMNKMRDQAVSMIAGNLKQVFEIKHESEVMRTKYGKNSTGDACLLARRLVESGAQYISVNIGGWDMHTNLSYSLKQRVPQVDIAITALLSDLSDRGMLNDTLVLITTDFGRTPKINSNSGGGVGAGYGRDHWASLSSCVIAGGTYEHGRVIGKADKTMSAPDTELIRPRDVSKVVFDHFEIVNMQITDQESRPRWVYEKEAINFLKG